MWSKTGPNNFAVSDVNGNYVLTDVNRNSTLIFSFVGMLREEIQVGNRTRIDVVMREDAVSLEEVVAIGYGTVKNAILPELFNLSRAPKSPKFLRAT